MTNILKNQIDIESEQRELRKEVRHIHHLVIRKPNGPSQAANENDEEEMLSDYIPWDKYNDLQQLDEKLWDNDFFLKEL